MFSEAFSFSGDVFAAALPSVAGGVGVVDFGAEATGGAGVDGVDFDCSVLASSAFVSGWAAGVVGFSSAKTGELMRRAMLNAKISRMK